ncbi:MAG: sortase, partial [Chloroflexota bacterium]|nr:sortase [Chloroflexota bacterium]
FLVLWNAEVGDDVIVTTPDGRTLRYAVTQVIPAVPPDDVSVTQETPDERLTLQTSTGPVPQDPRSVVIAKPAS